MKQPRKLISLSEIIEQRDIAVPLVIMGLLLVIVVALAFYGSASLGWITLALGLLLLFAQYLLLQSLYRNQTFNLNDIANRIDSIENEILLEIPLGIIIFHEDRTVRWMNPYMQRYFIKEGAQPDSKEFTARLQTFYDKLLEGETDERLEFAGHYFDVGLIKDQNAMYFLDVTRYGQILAQANENRFVIGHILIDNYDEVVARYSDRRKSNIDNYVMKQLSAWSQKYNSYLKRIDNDRFLMVTMVGRLTAMEAERFNIVDSIREATSKANFPLTVSMGFAYQTDLENVDLSEVNRRAQSNLDLAQSRGGDQVVIKADNEKARFYGGKSNPMEKRTHVRARQVGTTLSHMMKENDEIFVMGHDYPDMDAIGACLGIRRMAEMNGKTCHIVLNEEHLNEDIQKLITVLNDDETIRESFVSPEEAEEMITPGALLFLVDCHRQSITVAPKLIDLVNGVIIIDHHRKGEDAPTNIMLEYIEPYASSACELITEFFEYQEADTESINQIEATTMLAGIVVDSRSFSLRTGSRTFDAASYLKSCGADSILIQEFLKEDFSDYIKRSHLIENVNFVDDNIGIAAGEDDVTYPTVLAAQAADELLSMNGISASYVVFLREDGRVGISARSMGNVNVQTVMEQLGGGGHLSNAATQIDDVSVSDAVALLQDTIKHKEETA